MTDWSNAMSNDLTLTPSDPRDQPRAMMPFDASPQLERAREVLDQVNTRVVKVVRDNPVPCLIGAAAVGYLLGRAAARRWLW